MLLEVLLYLLAGVSGIIFLIHFSLGLGVLLNRFRDLIGDSKRAPGSERVTVIVVAKDEEQTLPALFESLRQQSISDFQVVLVDDRSLDGTVQIMERFRAEQGDRVKIVTNRQDPGDLNPKQFALDIAVGEADGEVLIFTDADCLVPPQWVERMLQYFQAPRVGVVFGQTSLNSTGTFLDNYQAFDQPLIHQYSSGSAGLGVPTGCFGRNLAARKRVIQELGGFRGLGYTPTEDAALISAAGRRGWKVRVSTRLDTMIETRCASTWRDFINQHIRWNSGGFHAEDPATRWGYRTLTLYLVLSVLVTPAAPFFPLLWMLPITSFVGIGLLALLSGLLFRRDRVWFLLRIIPYTLFFMGFYSLMTVFSMLRVSTQWKGRILVGTNRGRS